MHEWLLANELTGIITAKTDGEGSMRRLRLGAGVGMGLPPDAAGFVVKSPDRDVLL